MIVIIKEQLVYIGIHQELKLKLNHTKASKHAQSLNVSNRYAKVQNLGMENLLQSLIQAGIKPAAMTCRQSHS